MHTVIQFYHNLFNISIIPVVKNASGFLDDALSSCIHQTYRPIELVIFDDGSTDDSLAVIGRWEKELVENGVRVRVQKSEAHISRGPGFARNEAVIMSSGEFLCHLDADDRMHPDRIRLQLELATEKGNNCLVGCNFDREPLDSTPFYARWLNEMDDKQLVIQQYRECTIICPSWFYHRDIFDKIAKFRSKSGRRAFVESTENERIRRIPEDMYFFLDHLSSG